MDIFNNEAGRGLAQNPPINMNAYGTLLVRIFEAIQNGDLVYLNPIDYTDPNFWDDPTTSTSGDGTHGITASAIITQTTP